MTTQVNVSGWAVRHGSQNIKAPMYFTLTQKHEGSPVFWTFINTQALLFSRREDVEAFIVFMKRHPSFNGKKPEPQYIIF